MSAKQPEFRIMKKGYDRFAVDAAIDRLNFELESQKAQLTSYMKQAESANEQLALIKERYQALVSELNVREKAADDIARLALREANTVIASAQNNADSIVQEALTTAKLVLVEIARISKDAKHVKADMQAKLEALSASLEAFIVPTVPALNILDKKDSEQDAPRQDPL